MPHFLGPNAMRALRVCLALACVGLGVTTLPDGVSARTQPTTWITVTYDAIAAGHAGAPHGPVVLPHETEADDDPHKLLIEPPAAPAGLTAEQGRVDGEVKLSWNAPAPADDIDHHDYRYHSGRRYSAWTSIPASGSSSNHVAYVNGLTRGVAHTFQVRAINTNGDPSLPSTTATATPRGGAPQESERGSGDPAGVAVTLELSPSSIGEGSEVSTVTASLGSASATALTVTVSAVAMAPAVPGDFTLSANRTLAIAAGALTSTGTVRISAEDNAVDEPDKDVTVSGTVAGATDVTGPSDVTLTITDDDRPTATTCTGGNAGVNLCSNVDLMAYLAMNDIGGGVGSDIWGWQDSVTGKEYAIMGRSTGTAFVDLSDPLSPIYLGDLPPHSEKSQWRDIKVYLDHAFIVSEAAGSGMQVFDLTQLRTVSSPPVTFSETAHYTGFSDAHNISINTDSGFAYAVGTDTCDGGLHMINIQNPMNPTSAGCFSDDGYTHDTQCVNYVGPDPDHQGAEICFNSNTDALTIVDVTNKAAPRMLSRTGYTDSEYTHQGWLTEDHAYFLLGDEFDEARNPSAGSITYVWDVNDLDSPTLIGTHESRVRAIDHNQYVNGKYTYQSNYQAGLRILDVTNIANGELTEVAFFDMVPDGDLPLDYEGSWGNYPFFDSGFVIVSVRTQGLFVLRPNLVDRIQPRVGRAAVDGETLTLTFGEALDTTSTPATNAFTVTVGGAARSVSDISLRGRAVALTLASAVTVAQEVRVTYTVPETSPIRDEAKNNAPGLSSRWVRNDTPGSPGTPVAPTVTAASATSLTVTWAEPPNAKPPITDYDVRYRIGSSGSFTDWPHAGTAQTSTINRLTEGTAYEVQVLARNPEGTSSWSPSGSGTAAPLPNTAPTASARATTPTTVNGLGRVTLDGTATDPEGDTLTFAWTSSRGGTFDDASAIDTTWTAPAKTHARQEIVLTLTVTDDGTGRLTHTAQVNVTVPGDQPPRDPIIIIGGGGGGGGGGGPSGPSPSEVDFEWTVRHDIEALDPGHDTPSGLWSDGTTLWILENGEGADDAVYAYDLNTGERVEEREFELAEANRAPRGLWSDREAVWISDSGQDRLFAYDLAGGERVEEREFELAERNGDARGICSDGETMWVLDGSKNALFAYDLASGELLGEYALAPTNGDARGIWSDGTTVWVSDHGAKRLLAYRLPEQEAEDGDEPLELVRLRNEEFKYLSKASNNSPRGIWSDGDVMYVADASDDKAYTYNMPDAIDARLASLTLSGVDMGEFSSNQRDYQGTRGEGVTETTVASSALQGRATVVIGPPDADPEAEGHQVSLRGLEEITVVVTSADGSRRKVYRVAFDQPVHTIELTPTWTPIEWPGPGGPVGVALRESGSASSVLVIYQWDAGTHTWLLYFPELEEVPGLRTLTTLVPGYTYWVAVTEPTTWTVQTANP